MAARIASLPREDPFAALALLAAWLTELSEARGMPFSASLSAVELLDHAARSHYRDATRRYLHEHGLRDEDDSSNSSVEDFLGRLAQRYQSHVVLWRATALKQALPKPLLVRSIAGGVRACAAVMKWGYLRRTTCPVGLWADMSTLYGVAEAAACAQTPIDWLKNAGASTAEREFLKGCMLAAGAPQALSPDQVDVAERLVGYCAGDLGLAHGGDPRYTWFIDLESGEPPCPVDQAALPPARLRSFGLTSPERFSRLLHLVDTDRLTPAAFGTELDKGGVLGTLRHLMQRWLPASAARERLAA
jgi:hypothetical protein